MRWCSTGDHRCSSELGPHLRDLYGVDVSADLVSAVTDAVLEEIAEWQNRPLEPLYALVFFDANSGGIIMQAGDANFVTSATVAEMPLYRDREDTPAACRHRRRNQFDPDGRVVDQHSKSKNAMLPLRGLAEGCLG